LAWTCRLNRGDREGDLCLALPRLPLAEAEDGQLGVGAEGLVGSMGDESLVLAADQSFDDFARCGVTPPFWLRPSSSHNLFSRNELRA